MIIVAPNKKAKYLIHLFPGNANSSTINSEQDTYMKVPPARLVKIITTIGDEDSNIIPNIQPKGVAQENKDNSLKSVLNSLKLL